MVCSYKMPFLKKREAVIRMKRIEYEHQVVYLIYSVDRKDIQMDPDSVRFQFFTGLQLIPLPDGSIDCLDISSFDLGFNQK